MKLWNFRKFGKETDFDLEKPHLNLPFKKGVNVLIGENDSGKTAIVDAIKLVLKTHSYDWIKVSHEDFFLDSNRFRIELFFVNLSIDEAKNFTEWLGWHGTGKNAESYLRIIYDVRRQGLQIFPSDVRAGVDTYGNQLTAEAREYLKLTYLKPLRDAKSDLIPKRNSRLSQILQGHHAFKGKENSHHLMDTFQSFNKSIELYFEGKEEVTSDTGVEEAILPDNNGYLLKQEIDKYIKSFYDNTTETELRVSQGSLKNVLEKLELTIKQGYNLGLGTLNRLFMASELLHLNKSNWGGVRLGLIEELEAHLHPQAQMQVIEALQQQENIQLILTTHSPNLASKVKIENLILCNSSNAFPMGENYTELQKEDYIFLEKFLDATKSNLFFAKGIIMVEGWSEEIFLPTFAKKLKKHGIIDKDLTEAGISVINVGNTAFLRYSRIFKRKSGPEMKIPVALVTDSDIRHYSKVPDKDGTGATIKTKKGKIKYRYETENPMWVSTETNKKIATLEKELDGQNVKSFIAPHWTFEYSLYKSTVLGELLENTVKKIHTKSDFSDFEKGLAAKLINKGLSKTNVAYTLAVELEKDLQNDTTTAEFEIDETDEAISYLIKAIKYASGI